MNQYICRDLREFLYFTGLRKVTKNMNFLDRLSMTTYEEDLDEIHKFTEESDLVELDPEDLDRILVYTFSPIDLKMPRAGIYGQDNHDSCMCRTIEIQPQLWYYPPFIPLRQVLMAFIENNRKNNQILKKYKRSGPGHYFYEGMTIYPSRPEVWRFNRWGS